MMSPALMGRCAADGRSIIWLNRSGKFMARMEGPVNGNFYCARHNIELPTMLKSV